MNTTDQKPKVLIVDDHKGNRALIKSYLDACVCLEASSAKDALTLVKKHPDIRVVIMDHIMPGLNGLDAIEKLRADNPQMQFIMVTAHESVKLATSAIHAGVFDFLVTPLKKQEITSTINNLFNYIDRANKLALELAELKRLRIEVKKYKQKYGEI